MRAVSQWSCLAALLLSTFLLFLKMDIYKLSVSPTCKRVDVGIKVTRSKALSSNSSQVISLLMPNPCGLGKNRCLVSPSVRKTKTAPVRRDIFEKCNFLDEKLNDVDCSVERDTRDYVGEIHMQSFKTNCVCMRRAHYKILKLILKLMVSALRRAHYKIGHSAGTGGSVRHYHLCYCLATRQFRWPFITGNWEIIKLS